MNKKVYTSILLFTGFVLSGIIILQLLWLNNMAAIRKKELDMETRQALSYTADQLEKKENVEAVMNIVAPEASVGKYASEKVFSTLSSPVETEDAYPLEDSYPYPEQDTLPAAEVPPTIFVRNISKDSTRLSVTSRLITSVTSSNINLSNQCVQVGVDEAMKAMNGKLTGWNDKFMASNDSLKKLYDFNSWNNLYKRDDHNQLAELRKPAPKTWNEELKYSIYTDMITSHVKEMPVVPVMPVFPELSEEINTEMVKNWRVAYTTERLAYRIDELDSIMQHVALEMDLKPLSERTHPDTLKNILSYALKQKGIDIPFEFAVVNQDSVLFQSPGYVISSAAMNFETKLFPNDIFDKSLKLVMYYPVPSSTGYIFSRMKTMLMLTGIFTLGILIAFYLTVRSIRKQKKLGEMKSDFINNITHEFKTPIATSNIAIAAIENHQVRNDPGRFDYYTRVLKEENNKMNMHVEKVLQMAMMERGKIKMHRQKLDVNELLQNAFNGFQLLMKENHVQATLLLHPSPLIIKADTFHLENVFNNIIDNAVKYSGENAIISISTLAQDSSILVKIKDNGPGMSAEVKKNAFEQFYRGQRGDLHDVKGFGLGLNYVKKVMTLMKGKVSLKTAIGEGTEVTIELPLY